MRINWGHGIFLSFFLFCGFIIWLVVKSFQQEFHLVSNTYYQDELAYQTRIDEQKNLRKSGEELLVKQVNTGVVIEFPEALLPDSGSIHFYRPTQARFDRTMSIQPKQAIQRMDRKELVAGRYTLKVQWAANGISYYQEAEIFVK